MFVITIAFFFYIDYVVTPVDPAIFVIITAGAYYSCRINALKHIMDTEKGWRVIAQGFLFLIVFPLGAIIAWINIW